MPCEELLVLFEIEETETHTEVTELAGTQTKARILSLLVMMRLKEGQ